MPNQPLFPDAKPIDCDVLMLCEGDVLGYESQLLKLWADKTDLNGRFVKVLGCGTGDALFGMADAIGRTVPIIVIEDRDFRTPEEAKKECEKKAKNRERRNVAMRGWFAWQRAEIENYFTDDTVLSPVFADAFECEEDTVRDAVLSALNLLSVSQALEYALFRARKSWLSTDANKELRVETLRWDASGCNALSAEEVRDKLGKRLEKWQQSLHDGTMWEDPMAGHQLLADFNSKCMEWASLPYNSLIWRRDCACKEVVKHVRMALAKSKAGWWGLPDNKNEPVTWESFKNDEARNEHDRWIERQIQPKLVRAVAGLLDTDTSFDLRAELEKFAKVIRDA